MVGIEVAMSDTRALPARRRRPLPLSRFWERGPGGEGLALLALLAASAAHAQDSASREADMFGADDPAETTPAPADAAEKGPDEAKPKPSDATTTPDFTPPTSGFTL